MMFIQEYQKIPRCFLWISSSLSARFRYTPENKNLWGFCIQQTYDSTKWMHDYIENLCEVFWVNKKSLSKSDNLFPRSNLIYTSPTEFLMVKELHSVTLNEVSRSIKGQLKESLKKKISVQNIYSLSLYIVLYSVSFPYFT